MADQPTAAPVFDELKIGPLRVWPPVVLAPMAGVTDSPYRRICRDLGAPLCVSEMITARPLVDRNQKTLALARFHEDESPRSLQLYGTDEVIMGRAVERLVSEHGIEHIDLNFGCPVRKVTRKGGGAALPAHPNKLAAIVRAAVSHAGDVPVTMKFRMGIDDETLTYLDAGRIGQEEGCRAVALHARTAAQLYSGQARWEAIAELKRRVTEIPVLGNGDIWQAEDAVEMMRSTGCDGVVIGRGCLGRPWLFRELVDRFEGRSPAPAPRFGEVAELMLEHARRLCEWRGEAAGIRAFRKHATWYTKGFRNGTEMRGRIVEVGSLEALRQLLERGDPREPYPTDILGQPRGKTSKPQRVSLPANFLSGRDAARENS
jgi:nifR3 family TIM-barrel protein